MNLYMGVTTFLIYSFIFNYGFYQYTSKHPSPKEVVVEQQHLVVELHDKRSNDFYEDNRVEHTKSDIETSKPDFKDNIIFAWYCVTIFVVYCLVFGYGFYYYKRKHPSPKVLQQHLAELHDKRSNDFYEANRAKHISRAKETPKLDFKG